MASPQQSESSEYVVDLRSDTVTLPTQAMKEAVLTAPLGDDVLGEDPTVIALQERVAALLGKEKALFVPSGTMGNLICVLSHCWERGSEIIIGDRSHINVYEQGGISQVGGVFKTVVKNLPDGTFSLEELKNAVRKDDVHFPVTTLVCIENTHNMMGGKVLPLEWLDEVGQKCKDLGLPLHVDGARLLNASVALDVPPERLVRGASSVTICLSKGLGAPVGSVIAGSELLIQRATRLRKLLGGGMRQSGVLAAMGIVALDEATATLRKDHERLRAIKEGITALKTDVIQVNQSDSLTNILILDLDERWMSAAQFCERLEKTLEDEVIALGHRIICKCFTITSRQIRFVTHRDLSDDAPSLVVQKIGYIVRERCQ